MNTNIKKVELINFIKWKERNLCEEERIALLKKINKMSYIDLKAWAIRNDIID